MMCRVQGLQHVAVAKVRSEEASAQAAQARDVQAQRQPQHRHHQQHCRGGRRVFVCGAG